jgi:NTE family protein
MKALVLSGGGVKCAYSASVIFCLLNELQIHYSLLCGTSAGAINAAFIAQFSQGQEQEAAQQLYKLWLSLSTKHIYKRHSPFGKFHSLWKPSLLDSSPLAKLIKSKISLDKIRASGKNVCVGTVSAGSGEYKIFTQHDDDFIDAVVASASFPGLLAPIKIRGQYWIDGGGGEHTPIKTAIDYGAQSLDIIVTSPERKNVQFVEHPSTGDILKRALDLAIDKVMDNDVERLEIYNQLALAGVSNKKVISYNIIRPDYNLIEDLLDFDPQKIKKMMELGYQDAKSKYKTDI